METIVSTTYAATTTERGVALKGQGGLYWLDASTDGLYRAHFTAFTGTPLSAAHLLNLQNFLGGNSAPNGLASDGTALYWSDGASGARGIYRTDCTGLNGALVASTQPTSGSPSLALTAFAVLGAWQARRIKQRTI